MRYCISNAGLSASTLLREAIQNHLFKLGVVVNHVTVGRAAAEIRRCTITTLVFRKRKEMKHVKAAANVLYQYLWTWLDYVSPGLWRSPPTNPIDPLSEPETETETEKCIHNSSRDSEPSRTRHALALVAATACGISAYMLLVEILWSGVYTTGSTPTMYTWIAAFRLAGFVVTLWTLRSFECVFLGFEDCFRCIGCGVLCCAVLCCGVV